VHIPLVMEISALGAMLHRFALKLNDNRVTRPSKRRIVESIVTNRGSRMLLNSWYSSLSEEAKRRFYLRYAKIFRRVGSRLEAGEWKIRFSGRDIRLPLRPDQSWLDWDHAVSILGHDLEVKQTYEALLNSDQRPDFFVDVGANYGIHSALFLSADIPVLAFEPNPSCFPSFKAVCDLNGFLARWEDVAIGNTRGSTELVYPEHEAWLGSLSSEIVAALRDKGAVIVQKTQIKTLDDYLDEIPPGLVVLKIDVEGFELEVLRGASRILKILKPKIIFESQDSDIRPDLYRKLEEFGYLLYSLPWRPSVASRRLGIDEFVASPTHNFIASHQ
jgi:FkbM family methyltransferase